MFKEEEEEEEAEGIDTVLAENGPGDVLWGREEGESDFECFGSVVDEVFCCVLEEAEKEAEEALCEFVVCFLF